MICGFLFMAGWAMFTVWGIYYFLEWDEGRRNEEKDEK